MAAFVESVTVPTMLPKTAWPNDAAGKEMKARKPNATRQGLPILSPSTRLPRHESLGWIINRIDETSNAVPRFHPVQVSRVRWWSAIRVEITIRSHGCPTGRCESVTPTAGDPGTAHTLRGKVISTALHCRAERLFVTLDVQEPRPIHDPVPESEATDFYTVTLDAYRTPQPRGTHASAAGNSAGIQRNRQRVSHAGRHKTHLRGRCLTGGATSAQVRRASRSFEKLSTQLLSLREQAEVICAISTFSSRLRRSSFSDPALGPHTTMLSCATDSSAMAAALLAFRGA